VLVTCEYLTGLNTACSWRDRQFRPLIEARVQTELYELLLEWIEASPEKASDRKVSREVTASVISWAIFGAALDRSRTITARSSEEVADKVLSVIVEGLRV
jgi:hypothetical protein